MVGVENFLQVECIELNIKPLAGTFQGPENTKSSGKAYGVKRKKPKAIKNKKSKTKKRLRDKKNIGKRRKAAETNTNSSST